MKKNTFMLIAACLVIFGAGCVQNEPVERQVSETQEEGVTPTEEKPEVVPVVEKEEEAMEAEESAMQDDENVDADVMAALPEIDKTWQTYTNKSLGFSFQWPTRGRYAPEWTVTFIQKDDQALKDGCYGEGQFAERKARTKQTIDGVEFCRVYLRYQGAGQVYFTDYLLGKIDGPNILITFTKHLSNGSLIDDTTCRGELILPGSTCSIVEENVYDAHIDQIMGTFTLAE